MRLPAPLNFGVTKLATGYGLRLRHVNFAGYEIRDAICICTGRGASILGSCMKRSSRCEGVGVGASPPDLARPKLHQLTPPYRLRPLPSRPTVKLHLHRQLVFQGRLISFRLGNSRTSPKFSMWEVTWHPHSSRRYHLLGLMWQSNAQL